MKPKSATRLTGSNNSTARIGLFVIAVFLATSLIGYRLFSLTFIHHASLAKSAQRQYNNYSTSLSGRGSIYFSDLSLGARKIAATNRKSFYLYIDKNINLGDEIILNLASILKEETSVLKSQLSQIPRKGSVYFVVARNLTREQSDRIRDLKIDGVNTAQEVNRFYPQASMAAHILGFVGFDGNQRVGQYGVESFYDNILSGLERPPNLLDGKVYLDILNFLGLKSTGEKADTEEDAGTATGSDIILTIDQNVQSLAESKLDALLKKWNAPSGSIIIQEPNTGEILAMAASPAFDPNNYSDYKLENFINPNVQEIFEPGSSFKSITMAAAIDTGAVTPETTYYDTGEVKIGTYSIKNFNEKANGTQTMRQVLQHSLNTGAIFAQRQTGDDNFLNYVVGFGFGQKTGIDLSGEVLGNISNLYSGRKINFATASFGQGIAVTPIQLINAYSAIANGGKLMRPHVVREIIYSDGSRKVIKPQIIGMPITQNTSNQLKSMLVDVVEKGFDKARVNGYEVAGKTGTAQIPDEKGGYLKDNQFIHNFVGFAPAYNPRFTILIKMDRPKGIKFAADSLSPVFGDITRFLLRYFNIPPTRPENP
jgi:cell division protein FtsI (penicillin-binding protein 3)/stage V sporulation protein D (sporulation-specific penicillin-binding protein)